MTPGQDHPEAWLRVESRPVAGAPALFLDRDGTVIENVPYLNDERQIRLIEGGAAAIEAFKAAGFAIIIVTNQSGVARGICSPEQYAAVDRRLQSVLGGASADIVYACPFHPDGVGDYAIEHSSRKPDAGMILDAARRFDLDLAASVMVGDSLSDIEAGARAGVGRLVHVLTGHGEAQRPEVERFAASTRMALEYVLSLADVRPDAVRSPAVGGGPR